MARQDLINMSRTYQTRKGLNKVSLAASASKPVAARTGKSLTQRVASVMGAPSRVAERYRSARSAASGAWDEAKHPRDAIGRWAEKGAGAARSFGSRMVESAKSAFRNSPMGAATDTLVARMKEKRENKALNKFAGKSFKTFKAASRRMSDSEKSAIGFNQPGTSPTRFGFGQRSKDRRPYQETPADKRRRVLERASRDLESGKRHRRQSNQGYQNFRR